MKILSILLRGLLRGLTWPYRALYRLFARLFGQRGPVITAASAVGILFVFLLAWNFAIAPGLMILQFMQKGKPRATVETVQVQTVSWTPGIEAVGSAKAFRGADLATEADGVVKSILFAPQSHVEAGQQLTQIDDAVEQADLIAGSANVKLAETAVARASELRKKGVNAQSSLDDARNQLDVARSGQARTTALIDQKALKAPFAGMVGIPRVDVGQYVTKGTVIVTLQDLDRLYVDFTVPEQSAGKLSQGQPVHFGLEPADLPYSGTVVGVDPHVDPKTRLVNVRAEIADAQGRVLPGQFVRLRVDLPTEPNVLAVPATAVVPSLYGDVVYVIAPPDGQKAPPGVLKAGVAKQVIVELGRHNGGLVEIKKGVSAGELVINGGQNKLQSGAEVVVSDLPAPGAVAAGGSAP